MTLFRLRLRLKAPLGTPLTSGTLFGHLCWAKREADGEAALSAWLNALPLRPWALSDAFPADRLPFPMLPPAPIDRPERMDASALARMRAAKEEAKRPWVTLATWQQARGRCNAPILHTLEREEQTAGGNGALAAVRTAHNTIDRHTGSTPDEGGLYFLDEDWRFAADPLRDVYVRAETSEAELRTLITAVGEAGYGRDATYGRGHFALEAIDDAAWLDDCPNANRMLSLSQGALSPNMREPRYKLYTLFGKVGAGLAAAGVRPWKKPLLLTRAGCTFRPEGDGPFGAWLTGVHQDRPEVGHNAFHLAIPYAEAGT